MPPKAAPLRAPAWVAENLRAENSMRIKSLNLNDAFMTGAGRWQASRLAAVEFPSRANAGESGV
jgi:hypothetical protein